MSAQRIRYIKEVDGSYRSGQYVKSVDGKEYVCGLSPDMLTGYVCSTSVTDPVMVKVAGPSSHKTKIAVKKVLEQLGVVFVKESREGRSE